MAKNNTLTEQEELFTSECKLINLRYEYAGYTGTEHWAIITELSKNELFQKYPDVISRYMPFVMLSMAQGNVIEEAHRNDDKYAKRSKRTIENYEYDDNISQQFHKELVVPYIDPIEAEEIKELEQLKTMQRNLEIMRVREILAKLQPVQRQRLIKYVLEGKSVRQIAIEEGTYHSSVSKSITAAIKNFKKFYEKS